MLGKISLTTVGGLRPSHKNSFLWDESLNGFGIKITPSGKKIYIVQYRTIGGRQSITKRYTIGTHGSPWTPDNARKEAKRILGLVATGTDPAEEKTASRKDLTVNQLCELYLKEGIATKKASTIYSDTGRIKRHIIPLIGRKKLASLSRADMERFLQDIGTGKTATVEKTTLRGKSVVKGGKGTASRTLGLLGGIFTFAVDRGLLENNPVRGVKRYKDKKRERYLSAKELAALGKVLSDPALEEHPAAINALRLLLLTGCRKSEILGLKWKYIDFERGYLRLPESKTNEKIVPLGPPAIELLSKLTQWKDNEYVFPGEKPGMHFQNLQKAWERIRERAGLGDVRIHDLRHSFASVGASGGSSLLMIGAILGHKDISTTKRYAHLADDPVKQTTNLISKRIAALMDSTQTAKVVRLKKNG